MKGVVFYCDLHVLWTDYPDNETGNNRQKDHNTQSYLPSGIAAVVLWFGKVDFFVRTVFLKKKDNFVKRILVWIYHVLIFFISKVEWIPSIYV